MNSAFGEPTGAEIRVRGRVQGVGFRPTVWRLANRLGLSGEVFNDGDGVLIRIAAGLKMAERLVAALKDECPPLARIDSLDLRPAQAPCGLEGFHISVSGGGPMNTQVAPDAATCPACLAEIRDPFARRFRYPFTNCTHCGPRLSIVARAPFDRARTTMAPFAMCEACRSEYENPEDRRFHAQPIACHACGPKVSIARMGGGAVEFSAFSMLDDADAVAGMLLKGHIVAIKGIGGYHLACDATNEEAVSRLRARKRRYGKPFALMARDLDIIRRHAVIGAREEAALGSTAAPIVLLAARSEPRLPDAVSNGLSTLGFMLPYTPLHHLIFRRLDRPMVMTSGNLSDEPQVTDDEEARERLGAIADFILSHDREIAVRLDDSVVRVANGEERVVRRARGFAPAPLPLPEGLRARPPLLAMGAELKNTFCLAKDGEAMLSHHMGDLEDAAALADLEQTLALYETLYEHRSEAVAVDLHPDYLSTKLGRRIARDKGLPLIEVQHHHAHIASCLAENGVAAGEGPVLGVALDGLGFGDDGALWGGEFLLADYAGYRRIGTFKPVALPGGAQAMREPWRNALAHILAAVGWPAFTANFAEIELYDYLKAKPVETMAAMIKQELNAPPASSCGRLFDAVAAAIGLCRDVALHEGEAAMRLEALVDADALAAIDEDLAYPFALPNLKGLGLPYIEPAAMWQALLGDLYEKAPPSVIAARFHKGLARAVAAMACKVVRDAGVTRRVALSGGVFQNRPFTEEIVRRLEAENFEVLLQAKAPTNDGGISLGQAAVAAARLAADRGG
ncbi:carbamoyltransferase HypF [Methylocapsa acidiphila]|uniref:carbamoyltransferase HypF n=1 Tax=Methylocapsa acidiphila TaxID=133552 RepID=UPI00042A4096|nr:carbamoyltransferase HypF [Methylocapsa acidiphila]